jgi:hypothetical protein
MERPLPDEVARPTRAYVASLVPDDQLSDAWHELLADVAYWGDRELLPVLRLAHQVVLQHERVTGEVAALALCERGLDDPADVAAVLDVDADTARRWTRLAIASRDADADAPRSAATPAPAEPVPPPAPAPDPAPDDPALRIGSDEDGPPPRIPDQPATPRPGVPSVALAVVAIVVVAAVLLWVLLG